MHVLLAAALHAAAMARASHSGKTGRREEGTTKNAMTAMPMTMMAAIVHVRTKISAAEAPPMVQKQETSNATTAMLPKPTPATTSVASRSAAMARFKIPMAERSEERRVG